MGGVFKEKEKEHVSFLPQMEPVELLHHPIFSLGRSAENLSIKSESTYLSTAQADYSVSISKNISDLKLEAAPLSSRFARMLELI